MDTNVETFPLLRARSLSFSLSPSFFLSKYCNITFFLDLLFSLPLNLSYFFLYLCLELSFVLSQSFFKSTHNSLRIKPSSLSFTLSHHSTATVCLWCQPIFPCVISLPSKTCKTLIIEKCGDELLWRDRYSIWFILSIFLIPKSLLEKPVEKHFTEVFFYPIWAY